MYSQHGRLHPICGLLFWLMCALDSKRPQNSSSPWAFNSHYQCCACFRAWFRALGFSAVCLMAMMFHSVSNDGCFWLMISPSRELLVIGVIIWCFADKVNSVRIHQKKCIHQITPSEEYFIFTRNHLAIKSHIVETNNEHLRLYFCRIYVCTWCKSFVKRPLNRRPCGVASLTCVAFSTLGHVRRIVAIIR